MERAPQLPFLGDNVQINCNWIKIQLQAARRRQPGSQKCTHFRLGLAASGERGLTSPPSIMPPPQHLSFPGCRPQRRGHQYMWWGVGGGGTGQMPSAWQSTQSCAQMYRHQLGKCQPEVMNLSSVEPHSCCAARWHPRFRTGEKECCVSENTPAQPSALLG